MCMKPLQVHSEIQFGDNLKKVIKIDNIKHVILSFFTSLLQMFTKLNLIVKLQRPQTHHAHMLLVH